MADINTAAAICQKQYSLKDRSSCGRCPLIAHCHTAPAPGQEGLEAWQIKIEQAAREVSHA